MIWEGITWRNALVIAVFVVMCGFIAYFGDLLGRRLGKHRLSILGLRPRYTAILTTTITGMLIAALSITVMATVSQRVRLLMLQGDKIISERKLKEEQLADAKMAYNKASGELSRQRSVLRKASERRAELESEVARITRTLTILKGNLAKSEAELAETEKRLSTASSEIAVRKKEIAAQKRTIASLEAKKKEYQIVITRMAEDLGDAIDWYPKYIALREESITLHSGDELARRVILCSQTKSTIEDEILMLLSDADKHARAFGASSKKSRAITIRPKKLVTDASGKGRFLKEEDSIRAVVDNIATGTGSVVVRVIAVGNAVPGEQAMVELVPNYNKLVYAKGEEIASTILDGSDSRGQIFGGIVRFFQNDVRAAAMHKGIIPTINEDGEPSVGRPITGDQLLDLVDCIKAAGKPVRLVAKSVGDTNSADTLAVELMVDTTP